MDHGKYWGCYLMTDDGDKVAQFVPVILLNNIDVTQIINLFHKTWFLATYEHYQIMIFCPRYVPENCSTHLCFDNSLTTINSLKTLYRQRFDVFHAVITKYPIYRLQLTSIMKGTNLSPKHNQSKPYSDKGLQLSRHMRGTNLSPS